MDISVSASIDVNKCHGLCMYTLESTNAVTEDLSVNKLRSDVIESLNIHNCNFQTKIENGFGKRNMFPSSSKITSSAGESIEATFNAHAIIVQESMTHDNLKSSEPHGSCSPPLTTTVKPVSAMKGSREKHGPAPTQKLTVKWAPDVYDPVPSSVSHSVTDHSPQRHSKKNSKSKQKNGSKSSRGKKYKGKLAGKKGGG